MAMNRRSSGTSDDPEKGSTGSVRPGPVEESRPSVRGGRGREDGTAREEGWASGHELRPGRRGGRSVQQAAVAAAETSSRLRWRRELFEETAHGVALIDAASETIALVNAPFAMMHGYSPLELKGMPFWRLFAPVERAGVGALMRRLEDRGRVGFESLQQRRDGRSFPCWLDVSTVRDEAGSARYYVANIYDITDWKRKDERDRLLARAVALLGSSLDFEATLRRVIELSVPAFADWASFRVLENGKIRTIALYHRDPELQQLIYELERRYPLRPDCPVGVAKVLRTGESQLLPDVPASLIDALAVDAEHRALIERVGARSLLTVPVIARGEVVGAIALRMGGSGRKFDESDLEFAEELASRAAYAIDNARLYGRERRARKVAERLQAVTAALSTALTAEDVADAMIEQAMQVLGAQSGLVCRVSEDGTHFEIARTAGMHDAATADWQRFPVDPSLPMGDSVCRREPLYFATRAAMMRAYPALARSNESPASEAWVVAGLVVNGRPVGAMSFGFEDAREFTDDERAFVRSLTEACATAMDRARLYELERRRRMEADARKRRADLLAEASRLLSEHLDYEATLAAIAQSAVPHLADWCAVDILEDPDDRSWPPRLRQVALVHKDPNEIDRSRELMRQFPRDWSGERGLGRVLKDGVTEFHRVVDDALFRAAASSPEPSRSCVRRRCRRSSSRR